MNKLYYTLDHLRDLDSDTESMIKIFESFENHLENENCKDSKHYVQMFRMLSENLNIRIKKVARELDEYLLENKIE